jgi:hypothetical protein
MRNVWVRMNLDAGAAEAVADPLRADQVSRNVRPSISLTG